MYFCSKRIILLIVLLILTLSLPGLNLAQAKDQAKSNMMLKGEYSLVLRQSCVVSSDGFESVIQPDGSETFRLLGDASNVGNLVMSGILRFNKDGTGEVLIGGNETLSIVAFGHPQTEEGGIPLQSVRTGTTSCSLEYEVDADKMSFITESQCTTLDPGMIIVLAPLRIKGQFTSDRQMLILSHTKPNVETIEIICDGCGVAPDGTVLGKIERVCNRSGTAVRTGRMKSKDKERDD